jgi:hypothetical protein
MEGAITILANGLEVLLGPISFILGKVIMRVLIMVRNHQTVAGNLTMEAAAMD